MQDLDIISVNIWHIVISLANLVILFLILKKLLFKPVKKIVDKRQKELDAVLRCWIRAEWEGKMATAEAEADKIISDAVERADSRNEVMLYESREKADQIIRKAKADIERERKDARETIKKEIVDVSQTLSEQIIGREINMDDHRDLIDKAIDKIGEEQ